MAIDHLKLHLFHAGTQAGALANHKNCRSLKFPIVDNPT